MRIIEKGRIGWLMVVVLAAIFLWLGWRHQQPEIRLGKQEAGLTVTKPLEQGKLRVGGAELTVEVARTEAEKALGLGERNWLGEDEGMLFVFETSEPRFFWMKGMRFNLDFIFINKGEVVRLVEGVSYPSNGGTIEKVLTNEKADWVLEVNSGWVARHGVRVGDEVEVVRF